MKKNQILVVAAHADDEILGCGGTIARHIAEGHNVSVVFMADGVNSREGDQSVELEKRNTARDKALRILGVTKYYDLSFPDNQMDSLPLLEVVKSLENIVSKIKPSKVYTHHHGDLNIDHQIAHRAVLTACRPLPGSTVREIFSFEVMSSTDWSNPETSSFTPNTFVNISNFLDIKLNALKAYEMEMHSPPHSRSLEHIEVLARHRGSSVGFDAAEGFVLIRQKI